MGPGLLGKTRVNDCVLRNASREGMQAESHLEVLENKRKGRQGGSVNFVKFSEIANTVNSLDV
jgi:hypothetical protein